MSDNILIFGNGFDLAMGRKTSYEDFFKFVQILCILKKTTIIDDNPFKTRDFEIELLSTYAIKLTKQIEIEIRNIFDECNPKFLENKQLDNISDFLLSFSDLYYKECVEEAYLVKEYLPMIIEENDTKKHFSKWFESSFPFENSFDYLLLFSCLSDIETMDKFNSFTDINSNLILTYLLKNKEKLGENWSNIELAISDLVIALNDLKTNYDNYAQDEGYFLSNIKTSLVKFYGKENFQAYKFLSSYISENYDVYAEIPSILYLTQINEKLIKNLNQLTDLLEWYLFYLDKKDFVVNRIKTSATALDAIQNIEKSKVLTFNYTDTAKELFNISEENTHSIHGKINFKRSKATMNTMVFGIEDKEDNIESINSDLIPFQKFFQRTVKETGNNFEKFFSPTRYNKNTSGIYSVGHMYPKNIVIFGHSVDPLDKEIFKKCFNLAEESKYRYKFIFTYHNESAKRSIVKNLATILGKNSLIELTGQSKIVFVKSDDNEKMKKELL